MYYSAREISNIMRTINNSTVYVPERGEYWNVTDYGLKIFGPVATKYDFYVDKGKNKAEEEFLLNWKKLNFELIFKCWFPAGNVILKDYSLKSTGLLWQPKWVAKKDSCVYVFEGDSWKAIEGFTGESYNEKLLSFLNMLLKNI